MKSFLTTLLMIGLVAMLGCQSEAGDEAKDSAEVTEEAVVEEPEMFTKDSGVRYQELVVGEGVEAVNGTRLDCHYTLWFADSTGLEKGARFQSSKDKGTPYSCQLGVNLIAGWSDGMIGMKEGGTRRIFIPWELGYGAQGRGPIQPRTNLIFEIEFLKAR